MRHMAAYLMLKLGGNDNPSKDDISQALSAVGVQIDDAWCDKMLTELEGKDLNELLESGKELLAKFGGGGGGGAAAGGGGGDAGAAEEAKEEKKEEVGLHRHNIALLSSLWAISSDFLERRYWLSMSGVLMNLFAFCTVESLVVGCP